MLSNKSIALAVLISSGVLISGCGGGDDAPGSMGNSNDTSNPDGNGGNGMSTPSAFTGNWVQSCLADDPEDSESEYSTVTMTISADSAVSTVLSYTDSGCTIAAFPARFVSSVSLEFTGGTTSTSLGAAAHVNVTGESANIDGTPISAELAELTEFYVTEYDLLIVSGNFLYAGDYTEMLDGTTAEKRPTTIDLESVFTRQ